VYDKTTKLVPASSQESLSTFVPVCLISCHHIGPHRSLTVCISAQRERESFNSSKENAKRNWLIGCWAKCQGQHGHHQII